LKKEGRLRVFENRVLRRIFGPKRDEVTGRWRRLHKEELHSSQNIFRVIKSRRVRWAGHVARMGRGGMHTGFWWGNLRDRTLGIPRRRWEDNVKMNIQEVGGMDWIELVHDRDRWRTLMNTVMNFRVP